MGEAESPGIGWLGPEAAAEFAEYLTGPDEAPDADHAIVTGGDFGQDAAANYDTDGYAWGPNQT